MRITWDNSGFSLDAPCDADALLAKLCGFVFNTATARWCGDHEALEDLRRHRLKLSEPLTITELALREYKAAGQQVLNAVEQSHAQDSDLLIPVPPGLALLPFQKAGVAYAAQRSNVLIADEMGLGKTVQAIATANTKNITSAVIIAPASLKINWRREWKKWDIKHLDVQIIDGETPTTLQAPVVIVNYDVLNAHRAMLRERVWDFRIVDECHYLKNGRTDRTREVFGGIKRNKEKEIIDRCGPIPALCTILMTGTPILNKPKELWPLLQQIDPDGLGLNWYKFASRYCGLFEIKRGDEHIGWVWDGATNLEELQETMRSRFMVRRLKCDVLKDLPAKRRQVIVLEPKPQLAKLVAKELKLFKDYGGTLDITDNVSPAFNKISDERQQVAIKKVPYVFEQLKEVLREQEKVVVFTHHHAVTDALAAKLRDDGIAFSVLDGRTNTNERDKAVTDFQGGVSRVFIGSIQAAGTGLTLTAASVVIFAEFSWVPGENNQAEDRLHRIGQLEQVLVYYIVLEGSLDERMVESVIAKQEIADKTLDKKPKPEKIQSKEELFKELRDITEAA